MNNLNPNNNNNKLKKSIFDNHPHPSSLQVIPNTILPETDIFKR